MESLRLKNIKAFRDTGEIILAPLTILVGQNSSGKSSFLRFPAVLSQTMKCARNTEICLHRSNAELIDYGSYSDVIHNHTGEGFACSFQYTIKHHELLPYIKSEQAEMLHYQKYNEDVSTKIELVFSKGSNNQTIVKEISLYLNEELFCKMKKTKSGNTFLVTQHLGYIYDKKVDISSPTFEINCLHKMHFFPDWPHDFLIFNRLIARDNFIATASTTKNIDQIWNRLSYQLDPEERDKASCGYRATFIAFRETIFALRAIYSRMEAEIKPIFYIGPLRDTPQRVYRIDNISDEESRSHEETVVSSLYNNLRTNKKARDEVDKWLSVILDCTIDIKELDDDLFKVCLIKNKSKEAVNICDVGYGVSQLLPIIITCAINKVLNEEEKHILCRNPEEVAWIYDHNPIGAEKPMIIIEQPELHLHPAAQSRLAEMFGGVVAAGDYMYNKRSIIVETHSEHFIRALQVLVADPSYPITNEMIRVYYAESDGDNTLFREMRLTQSGQFEKAWPAGFFDKSYTLAKELLNAVAQRNMQQERESENDQI